MSSTHKKSNTALKTAGLAGVLVLFIGGIAAYSAFGSSQAYDESKTVPGANLSAITVRTSDVDVNVVPSDSNEVQVHFHGQGERNHYALSLNQRDGALEVTVNDPSRTFFHGFNINFGMQQLTLDVAIPKRDYEHFMVDTSSGDINMSPLEAKTLQLNASSGDILVSQFKGTNLEIKTSSGDQKISDIQSDLVANASSGDIEAHNVKGEHVNAHTSSGYLRLDTIEGDTSLTTTSGDMRLNGMKGSHLSATTSSGDQELLQVSGAEVDAHSSSGDVTLGLLDFLKNVTVNTSSGNADI
ncbi:MAG: DUF4097 family beta strand repeat-containing protein, partial [Tumebacillaceae bacterium]